MKAVVLVGGQGTRLRPLTFSTPKPMLPVVEMPLIERVVAHLARHGVTEVVLSLGYRPDAFLETFPEGTIAGVRVHYAVEPEPMDTGGGIAFAARLAGLDAASGGDERFLVVNGDVLSDWDLGSLVAFHDAHGGDATIALTPVEDPSAFGVVGTDASGRVSAFVEKPRREDAPSNLINAGYYVFEPAVVERLPRDTPVHIEDVTFPAMAADGCLYALSSDAYWTDTGTPALYLQANLDLLSGIRSDVIAVPVAGAAQRNDGVWLAGGPVVDGTVESPAFVGEAAYVGDGARVAGSVVGAGARVEAGAVVDGSVLHAGALVHRGAEVRGSIVGAAAIVGEGARLRDTVLQGGAAVASGAVLDGERVRAA